jgi:hypothetical protein
MRKILLIAFAGSAVAIISQRGQIQNEDQEENVPVLRYKEA